jgi:hypothetical protein
MSCPDVTLESVYDVLATVDEEIRVYVPDVVPR